MKKIINNIKSKFATAVVRTQMALSNQQAEGYVASGVKILIAVVIGALLLSLLYALFNSTIMPTVTSKITELFSFSGK